MHIANKLSENQQIKVTKKVQIQEPMKDLNLNFVFAFRFKILFYNQLTSSHRIIFKSDRHQINTSI